MGKVSREENEGGNEKSEGETDRDDGHAEASDESVNLSDVEVKGCFLTEHETILTKISWELINRDYLEKQAALKMASEALNTSNANCSLNAKNLDDASKANVKYSRKEANNAPPPATAMEAVHRTLEKKRLTRLINYDLLDELSTT